jgi:hypothetical protein
MSRPVCSRTNSTAVRAVSTSADTLTINRASASISCLAISPGVASGDSVVTVPPAVLVA